MNYVEVLNELRGYINSLESSIYLFNMKDRFKLSLNLIEKHIKNEESSEKIDEFDSKVVERTIDFLLKKVIEVPKKDSFYCFVDKYILLVFNWNIGVLKSEELTTKMKQIMRFIKDNIQVYEKVQILDILINNLNNYNKWIPPSFELSEHYFNLLKEE
jgi:hypothetical protein